jgi:tetratricopeptide (TPR) repeat protein
MRAVVMVLALSLPVLATAQPGAPLVAPAAQRYLERALRHFEARHYTKALEEFRAAYNIDPQPALLYAIAQAERLNGDCRRAIRFYEAFLRTGPNERQAPSARQNIERCKAELMRPPPTTQPAPLGVAARSQPEPARAAPPPSPRAPATDGASWQRDWAGHGLVLSGLAVGAAGVALWRVGHSTIDRANSARTYDEFAARTGSASTGNTEQKVGVAAMAVGGALVVAGVVHYVLHLRTKKERPTVTAAFGPGGALLVVARRF